METIFVTEGTNGYPENTSKSIVFDTMQELQNFANENRQKGEIHLMKKRDGWSFYEDMGWFSGDSLLDIPVNEYENCFETNQSEIEKDAYEHVVGQYDSIGQALQDFGMHDETDIDEALAILQTWKDRIEDLISEVSCLAEGENCLLFFNTDNMISHKIRETETMFTEDVWTYQLAFVENK